METIPKFGLPLSLGIGKGPAFMAKLSQLPSKAFNINWKLCYMYHPQSSRKVERINRTKNILTKYILDTDGN